MDKDEKTAPESQEPETENIITPADDGDNASDTSLPSVAEGCVDDAGDTAEGASEEIPADEPDEFEFVEDGTEDEDFSEAEEVKPRIPRKGRLGALLDDPRVLRYRYLGLCFIIPAFTMWLIYIAMGTYPFGDGSVLVLDLNGQYVYFFEQLREIVLGKGSFLYCFGRSLGGEFMGIYAYYLASPFSFIVCLFPKEMITEALLVMFLLKTGLCGLTFGIFLDYKTEKKDLSRTAIVTFSTIYALTAYAVVQQHNTMWIDNLIFLPLIVMGIDRLIKYGRFRLFVISLTIAVMSNFYIGYMMCIFVFFYFFLSYACMSPEERNPKDERLHFPKTFGRMAGYSAIVLSMACVILWSAYYGLTFGKTTFSNPSYEFFSKFDFLDLISKLFIGSYDTVRPEGLPFIYCGSLVLILLPIFFIIKKIPFREKILTGVMVVFFVFSFTGSTVDLVWHGFQRPNWLNYRYSFILCFFMVFAAYRAFLYIKEVDIRVIMADIAVWMLLLVILQKLDTYEWIKDYGTVWLSFAFFAAYLILLRFHIASKLPEGVSVAIASVVVLESFVGGTLNLLALGDDVVYSSRPSYRDFIDRIQPIVDMVQKDDDSFYRMEKTMHRKTNDALALGFRGLSNSTSTLNADTIKFLNRLGLSAMSHWTKYLGGTPVSDSLLGIKYLITEEGDEVSPLYVQKYSYVHTGENKKELYAYENPYALPIAYGVNGAIADYKMCTEDKDSEGNTVVTELQSSSFIRMNGIINAMLGNTDPVDIFVPIPLDDSTYEYCTLGYVSGGHKAYTNDSSEPKGRVRYTFTAPVSGEIYCHFPSDYPRKCNLILNGTIISSYYDNETNRIFDLGYYEAGEEIKVELRMDENDKLYIKSGVDYFYYIDENAFKDAMNELHKSAFEIEKYTEDSFYGKINIAEGDEFVFTSIPYDEGWVVKVDGQRVGLVETLHALVGFRVPEGEHTLTMEYRPPCIIYGRLISLGGLCVFIGVCVYDHNKRRRAVR